MTQLARPDLARKRSRRHHARPGPAQAVPADRPGLLWAGPPVPGWAVGTALLAPAVLVVGWLIAGALQSASYSPMHQTISVLAGQSGTDRWVMTTALMLVGTCQIATGAGLTAVRMPARILLILTGLSTLGIAATPEPARGPTSRHLAFAVSCVVTTAVWPVLVAGRAPPRSWILSAYGCATVTVLFAALSCWLLIAARADSVDLGLVERLTSAAQGLFPLVVALALRQTALRQTALPQTALRQTAGNAGDRENASAGLAVMGHMRHYGANCNGRGGWSRWTRSVSDRDAKPAGRRAACGRSPSPRR